MTNEESWHFDEGLPLATGRAGLVTVEGAAYGLLALLAAGLRLYQLGLRPLSEGEATQALAAFRFVQDGAAIAPAGTIPALFTGNVIGFSLLGASDITARWLPALAGLLLVLLPYGLRYRLGRGGALAASLLLAISPTAVYFSRALDSAGLVAACGLALVVALIRYLDHRRPVDLYLAAGALGLGLCAGPGMWSLVLILVAFGVLLLVNARIGGRQAGWASLLDAWRVARDEKGLLTRAGLVLAATFGLVATTLVLHPAGVGQAADLLGAWLQGFLPEPGGQPAVYPLLLLLRYEALIVVLGLVEAGRVVLRRPADPQWLPLPGSAVSHSLFFAFWVAGAGLLVLVAGHRPAGNVLLVLLPLALLAGQGVERARRWVGGHARWTEAALVAGIGLVLLVFFYLQVTAYSQASPASTVMIGDIALDTASTYLILAGVALVLLLALGAVAWIWRGSDLVVAGGWLILVVSLALFGFRSAWSLSVAHASDAREFMILRTTVPDVRTLVEEVEALSLAESGDMHTLPLTVDSSTGPVVAWYLRQFVNQTLVEGLSGPPATMAALTLASEEEPPIGETFRGQGFPLRSHWSPWGQRGQGLIRWLLFTEGPLPTIDREVVLWVESRP